MSIAQQAKTSSKSLLGHTYGNAGSKLVTVLLTVVGSADMKGSLVKLGRSAQQRLPGGIEQLENGAKEKREASLATCSGFAQVNIATGVATEQHKTWLNSAISPA